MIKLTEGHKLIIKQLFLHGAVVAVLCLWFLGIERTSDLYLNDVNVKIDKIEGVKDLITTKEIKHYVTKELPNDILNQKLTRIDLATIEQMLSTDTRIYNVEVFIDANRNMIVDIIQRRPVLRVMNQLGDQFYIDQSGHFVQKGDYRAIRVPVVTGYVENFNSNLTLEKSPRLHQAFKIAQSLRKDAVLMALIEQIHFEKKGRIILIPKIGEEKIILDHMDELEIKLGQLKAFYRELAKTDGWGKFKEIDISYKNVVYGRNPEQP